MSPRSFSRRDAIHTLAGSALATLAAGSLATEECLAQSPTEDAQKLTLALERQGRLDLPNEEKRECFSTAQLILGKPVYTAADWRSFFSNYFRTRRFTRELEGFLVHAAFIWYDRTIRTNIQSGLVLACQQKAAALLNAHPQDVGAFLASSPPDRADYTIAFHFLGNGFDRENWGDDGWTVHRAGLYDWARSLITRYPQYFARDRQIDPKIHPYVNWFRSQVYCVLRDAKPLTVDVKSEIASLLELAGPRAALWQKYAVLMHDNETLIDRDFRFLDAFIGSWPALPNRRPGWEDPSRMVPGNLAVRSAHGDWPEDIAPMSRGFTVTGGNVGSAQENPFPNDIPPFATDTFASILVHEVGHRLHTIFGTQTGPVNRDPHYRAWVEALLKDAGDDHFNYLRSMSPDKTFANAPFEFVASICQMYWANTELTLEVGRRRLTAAQRRHQPIEQFLFLLDVLSYHGTRSPGFVIDAQGELKTYSIPLVRDAQQRISRLTLPAGAYDIRYGGDGHVSAVGGPPIGSRAGAR